MFSNIYSNIEPFQSTQLQNTVDDFNEFIVNESTRLEKVALTNKMEEITNNLNTLDVSFNNHMINLNTYLSDNNKNLLDQNNQVKNKKQTYNELKSDVDKNLVSSLAAKSSFKNEKKYNREVLIETTVVLLSVFFSSYLIYKGIKN